MTTQLCLPFDISINMTNDSTALAMTIRASQESLIAQDLLVYRAHLSQRYLLHFQRVIST